MLQTNTFSRIASNFLLTKYNVENGLRLPGREVFLIQLQYIHQFSEEFELHHRTTSKIYIFQKQTASFQTTMALLNGVCHSMSRFAVGSWAVCVNVTDIGINDTPYGVNGEKRRFTLLYTFDMFYTFNIIRTHETASVAVCSNSNQCEEFRSDSGVRLFRMEDRWLPWKRHFIVCSN